jgi:hypothetical protein
MNCGVYQKRKANSEAVFVSNETPRGPQTGSAKSGQVSATQHRRTSPLRSDKLAAGYQSGIAPHRFEMVSTKSSGVCGEKTDSEWTG